MNNKGQEGIHREEITTKIIKVELTPEEDLSIGDIIEETKIDTEVSQEK